MMWLLLLLFLCSTAHAFQSGGLFRAARRTVGIPSYSTVSASYPSVSPFILPLLLENTDWEQELEQRGASTPEEEDDLLDYLPWFVLQQETPLSKAVILQATRQYIYADTRGDPIVNTSDILAVIDKEYKSSGGAPVQIGSSTYSVERHRDHLPVTRIMSFCAYHRLPTEITLVLLKGGDDDSELLKQVAQEFQATGWNGVFFPRGLAVRLPRNLLDTKIQRYQPIPRGWLLRHNQYLATKATKEASRIKAPPQQLLTKAAFLASLNQEMTTSREQPTTDHWKTMLKETLPFFPTRRGVWRFVLQHTSRFHGLIRKTILRIKQSVRATLLAYGLLAYCWYNISLLWTWQKLSATFLAASATSASSSFGATGGVLSCSLQRLWSVLGQTYSGLSLTNLPALMGAFLLAPIAHKVITNMQKRLDISDANMAVVLVGSTLALTHIFLGAGLVFLDAAILRTALFAM